MYLKRSISPILKLQVVVLQNWNPKGSVCNLAFFLYWIYYSYQRILWKCHIQWCGCHQRYVGWGHVLICYVWINYRNQNLQIIQWRSYDIVCKKCISLSYLALFTNNVLTKHHTYISSNLFRINLDYILFMASSPSSTF